jgi:predicted small secreted protein
VAERTADQKKVMWLWFPRNYRKLPDVISPESGVQSGPLSGTPESSSSGGDRMLNRKILWLMAVYSIIGFNAFALSACNTMRGAGEDIEASGEMIQEGAEETEEEIEE